MSVQRNAAVTRLSTLAHAAMLAAYAPKPAGKSDAPASVRVTARLQYLDTSAVGGVPAHPPNAKAEKTACTGIKMRFIEAPTESLVGASGPVAGGSGLSPV